MAPSTWYCPRCRCNVCDAHGRGERKEPYCAICAKEYKDDQDVARFKQDVLTPEADTTSPFGPSDDVPGTLFGLIYRTFIDRFGTKQPKPKTFGQRTPEDITEWRRTAGIQMRSR
jgi:hypothetical protein